MVDALTRSMRASHLLVAVLTVAALVFAAVAAAMHDTLAAYEAVGVQHMVVEPKERGLDNWLAAVEGLGRSLPKAA